MLVLSSNNLQNFECDVMPMGYEVYNITAKFELQIRGAGGSEIRLIERKFLWFEGRYIIFYIK